MDTDMKPTESTEPLAERRGPGLFGAVGLGAALMFFLDPDRGAHRRKLVLDKLVHARHVVGDAIGTTARDISNRAQGVAAATRTHLTIEATDDRVIEERVRAQLGRLVSHPSVIRVSADAGRVTLVGPVLSHEFETLIARTRKVRGVTDVASELTVHENGQGVPELQGGARRAGSEFELLQENWTPAVRFFTGVVGSALALYGARRRDSGGALVGLAGLALLARGATNIQLRDFVGVGGRRKAVNIQKTITIDAPTSRVYAFLTEWEFWPQWMSHVRSVTSRRTADGAERTHWVVDGPLGIPVAWDATTTNLIPDEEIAWTSIEGATIGHAGVIRLAPAGEGGTRVDVKMSYTPPGGVLGHAAAASFGRDPKRQMDDDLARLKTTIETGRPPRDAAQPESAVDPATSLGKGTLGDTAPGAAGLTLSDVY
jgi:uncharacterized membrane protein